MSEPLGTHLIIDFYTCLASSVSSPVTLQDSITNAMESIGLSVDEINCQVADDEIIITAQCYRCHVALHAYPSLGYVAADFYSFDLNLQPSLLMKCLKQSLGAERVKATSVQRGDFGSERDMKPRRRTSITPLGRVTRTHTKIKKTGTKLKSTGAKMIRIITKKKD